MRILILLLVLSLAGCSQRSNYAYRLRQDRGEAATALKEATLRRDTLAINVLSKEIRHIDSVLLIVITQ